MYEEQWLEGMEICTKAVSRLEFERLLGVKNYEGWGERCGLYPWTTIAR